MSEGPKEGYPSTLTNLSDVAAKLQEKGFTHDFTVIGGRIQDRQTGQVIEPGQAKIVESYRFEGTSDPDDSEALYALETSSGVKGLLVDAYGVYADPVKSDFIRKIELQHKIKNGSA